jgi:hypothetical protein
MKLRLSMFSLYLEDEGTLGPPKDLPSGTQGTDDPPPDPKEPVG